MLLRNTLAGSKLTLWGPQAAKRRLKFSDAVCNLMEQDGYSRVYTPHIVRRSFVDTYRERFGFKEIAILAENAMKPDERNIGDHVFGLPKVLQHIGILPELQIISHAMLPMRFYELTELYAQEEGLPNTFGMAVSIFGINNDNVFDVKTLTEIANSYGFSVSVNYSHACCDETYRDEKSAKKPIYVMYHDISFMPNETNLKIQAMTVTCTVFAKPGVMVPCEENIIKAAEFLGVKLKRVMPTKKYVLLVSSADGFRGLVKDLYNPAIEQIEILVEEHIGVSKDQLFQVLENVEEIEPYSGAENKIIKETRGYLLDGDDLTKEQVDLLNKELLVDHITERATVTQR